MSLRVVAVWCIMYGCSLSFSPRNTCLLSSKDVVTVKRKDTFRKNCCETEEEEMGGNQRLFIG